MISILFATDDEARPFLRNYKRGRFDGLTEGEALHDDMLLVSVTGSGKIKATLRTERLLLRHKPERVLHTGLCTSLKEEWRPGKIVTASQVFEGDKIELAAPTYPRMPLDMFLDGLPKCTMVTQDHDLNQESEIKYWRRIGDVIDTTAYAVAYVAGTHGVPCTAVKIVSSIILGGTGEKDTPDNDAPKRLAEFLIARLDRIEAKRENS